MTAEPDARRQRPALVFKRTAPSGGGVPSNFDVAPDGKRFLVYELAGEAADDRMTVTLNWFADPPRRGWNDGRGSMTLAAGTKLGPYEILAPIGAGGMGEVYKARDTRLDRTVAVKVLPPHLSSNPELRQRFEREAKTISQISHPHICALYDVNREGETEYLVMEYLEGETLADRLGKGPLPAEQLLRYGIEIADALDKAHRQGIVHRDLKPGNVMLTKSGVKLLDFGLAKFQARRARRLVGRLAPRDRDAGEPAADGARHGPRHVPVHGPRAARGQGRRLAERHLRLRRRALRDGDGQEGVLGLEPGLAHRRDPARRSSGDLRDLADDPAGA